MSQHTPTIGDRVSFTANGQHLTGEVLRVIDEARDGTPAATAIVAVRTIPGNQTLHIFADRIREGK